MLRVEQHEMKTVKMVISSCGVFFAEAPAQSAEVPQQVQDLWWTAVFRCVGERLVLFVTGANQLRSVRQL